MCWLVMYCNTEYDVCQKVSFLHLWTHWISFRRLSANIGFSKGTVSTFLTYLLCSHNSLNMWKNLWVFVVYIFGIHCKFLLVIYACKQQKTCLLDHVFWLCQSDYFLVRDGSRYRHPFLLLALDSETLLFWKKSTLQRLFWPTDFD